jgi:hypothetical protein
MIRALICRVLGHSWRYDRWRRPWGIERVDGWEWVRWRTCARCIESDMGATSAEGKPLDVVQYGNAKDEE